MTSTAEPQRSAAPSWWRTALLVVLLALLSLQAPLPWSSLWLIVPLAVAISLLAGWRFGPWAVTIPIALFVVAIVADGPRSLWAWWMPATALTGVWMGLREEGGGPSAAARAWMLLPVLVVAVALPWMAHYSDMVKSLNQELAAGDQQFIEIAKQFGSSGARLATMETAVADNAKVRIQALPFLLPSVLFVWMTLLVWAGRTIASRAAASLKWPGLSRARLSGWRLPDSAVWVFLLGLGMLVAQWTAAAPAAWTLLLASGLGYCIQGIAVVESWALARGIPPSVVVVTMAFVFTLATPVFMLTTIAVGLSDVWLDHRRMDARPDQAIS